MKVVLLILAVALLACHQQPKEEKLDIDVSKGVRIQRGPDGKVIARPDSSRMDSL
jgi:hypothetical protein